MNEPIYVRFEAFVPYNEAEAVHTAIEKAGGKLRWEAPFEHVKGEYRPAVFIATKKAEI